MKKPIIGVLPLWDEKRDSIWMLPGYLRGVSEAGGVPIVLPLELSGDGLLRALELCDGFLFTGGQDVAPEIYGEERGSLTDCCEKRDRLDSAVLDFAVNRQRAVFGICRGIQFINAFFGGTLYQDLPSERPSDVVHSQKPPFTIPSHEVDIVEGTPLHALLGLSRLAVNSYHHQGVKTAAEELEIMAYSSDGIVEAVRLPSHKFLWAVQWHPELSFAEDESSRRLFKAFVLASGE